MAGRGFSLGSPRRLWPSLSASPRRWKSAARHGQAGAATAPPSAPGEGGSGQLWVAGPSGWAAPPGTAQGVQGQGQRCRGTDGTFRPAGDPRSLPGGCPPYLSLLRTRATSQGTHASFPGTNRGTATLSVFRHPQGRAWTVTGPACAFWACCLSVTFRSFSGREPHRHDSLHGCPQALGSLVWKDIAVTSFSCVGTESCHTRLPDALRHRKPIVPSFCIAESLGTSEQVSPSVGPSSWSVPVLCTDTRGHSTCPGA